MSEFNSFIAVGIKAIENEFNRRKAEDRAQIAKLEAQIAKLESEKAKDKAKISKLEAEKAEDKAQFAKFDAKIAKIEARLNEPGSASQLQVEPISVVNAKAKSKKEKNNARAKKKRDEERRNCGCGGITSIDVDRALVHEGSDKHKDWLKANNICLPAVDPEEEDDAFSCASEGDEEEEEEELEREIFKLNGVEYLIDALNLVYDRKTEDIIGTYDSVNKKIVKF